MIELQQTMILFYFLSQLLTEKIEEFKWQKNEYDKLVAENQQMKCYKRNLLMVEQEKRELESKLAVISSTRFNVINFFSSLTKLSNKLERLSTESLSNVGSIL
jgi:hypothetical protein